MDLKCKQCKGPVPRFVFGLGHYYITPSNAERGPYCSEQCMHQAQSEDIRKHRPR